jgi:hypothetical protein
MMKVCMRQITLSSSRHNTLSLNTLSQLLLVPPPRNQVNDNQQSLLEKLQWEIYTQIHQIHPLLHHRKRDKVMIGVMMIHNRNVGAVVHKGKSLSWGCLNRIGNDQR